MIVRPDRRLKFNIEVSSRYLDFYLLVSFSSLPKISYMKALDIYLAVCFFMVFGALLEYATVSYAGKRIKLNIQRFEEFEKQVKEIKAKTKNQVPHFPQDRHEC